MYQPTAEHLKLLKEIGVSDEDPSEVFDVLERLGEGSFGAVYKCARKLDGQLVAVKVMPFNFDDHAALRQEIEILKTFSDPNIVSFHGTYFLEGDIWVAMEYCEGGSIKDIMQICDRTLTEWEISGVCFGILKGLAFMHKARAIHRDIKAGNVLLNSQGAVKLADFGVSAQMKHTWSRRNSVIGTPYWIAPEVLKQSDYNCSADIWSLGITAIEMAEGSPPLFDIHPMRALFLIPTKPPPTLSSPKAWSTKFHDFLSKCLVKDPMERWAALDLLSHPFVADWGQSSQNNLGGMVKEFLEIVENASEPEQAPEPHQRITRPASLSMGTSDRSITSSSHTCVRISPLTRALSIPRSFGSRTADLSDVLSMKRLKSGGKLLVRSHVKRACHTLGVHSALTRRVVPPSRALSMQMARKSLDMDLA